MEHVFNVTVHECVEIKIVDKFVFRFKFKDI